MLTFLGFMLLFFMFMIISLLPMIMGGALCLSSSHYAYLLQNMLITEPESSVEYHRSQLFQAEDHIRIP
ncbi:hypothetical protein CUU66_08145 [Peribacillus deserti]|uniref:Uncharacterized protein n=1 Tax=Peribacillus deserti TaxID=673318 RepID=A0A2N5M7N2_9BACI|nr:hypothetical protein CUU66_08145 [Peribacillus deserti]